MNILVIGNGFDLAHGLPTKYGDFLEFCERARRIFTFHEDTSLSDYKSKNIDNWDMNDYIKNALLDAFKNRNCNPNSVRVSNKALEELYTHIRQNAWLEYFLKCRSFVGENWIDFESEISRVIQALDAARQIMEKEKDINKLSANQTKIIIKIVEGMIRDNGRCWNVKEVLGNKDNLNKLIGVLESDLNRLIRAFEIYLCEFVEKVYIQKKSPNIDELEVDFILSFNYTHIFSTIYEISEKSKREGEDPFDYIHGEAVINNTIGTDTMVLGIDEYLSKKKRNKEIEFIAFKKYYQRIHKGTGCKYKDWVNQIKNEYYESMETINEYIEKRKIAKQEENTPKVYKWNMKIREIEEEKIRHNLYIFGHSLDITDKDILRDLILNDNVYTTIYYHKTYDDNGKDDNGRIDLGSKIANLVKIIGQDELIRRTGGSTKTIEFRLQQDMVEI